MPAQVARSVRKVESGQALNHRRRIAALLQANVAAIPMPRVGVASRVAIAMDVRAIMVAVAVGNGVEGMVSKHRAPRLCVILLKSS